MNTCAICHGEVKADTSCENCNPFTKARWSRKLTLVAAGLSAVVSLWFILFLIALAGQAIASSIASTSIGLGVLGSAASAAVTLVVGLGGSIYATSQDATVASLSFPNLVIPIGLWLLFKFTGRRFVARENRSVSNGIYFAVGAALSLLVVTAAAGSAQNIAGVYLSLGLNTLIPLFVVALMAYVSFSGTEKWPLLSYTAQNFRQYLGSVKRFQRVLWRSVFIASLYVALTMGTGLTTESPIWVWLVAGVALLVLMPTAAVVVGPFFLGVAISNSDIFQAGAAFASAKQWENDGQWISWGIVVFAALIAVASSIKSAANSPEDKNGWWKSAALGIGFGLAIALLGSVNININFLSLNYSQNLGLNAVALLVVFGLAGLVRGLFQHPVLHSIAKALDESPGSEVRKLSALLALQNWSVRKGIQDFYSTKHFVVRKLAKYTAVMASIGLLFALGHPLALVTQPLYDNAGTGVARFEHALKSGDVKEVKPYFDDISYGNVEAVIASSGLGDNSDLKIQAVKDEENTKKLSWNKDKFFLVIASAKSTTKEPFWGIIPQWDATISDSNLPTVTGKYNDVVVTNILYGKKVVTLNKIFFVPGKVNWTPDSDKDGFVTNFAQNFDSSKNVALKFDFQLTSGKETAIKNSMAKSFKEEFSDQCKSVDLKPVAKIALGNYAGYSGTVLLRASGKGSCDTKTTDQGIIDFSYDAVGSYSAEKQKWNWTFLFK